MIVELPAEINITPGIYGSYEDADLSALVPVGTVGVVIRVVCATTDYYNFDIRKKGSTDARYGSGIWRRHTYMATGVDVNGVCQIKLQHPNLYCLLTHYFIGTDIVFFTNCPNKSTGITGSYVDVDISGDTGADIAISAIFEWHNTLFFGQQCDLRCNGSTDALVRGLFCRSTPMIKVDANEIAEQKTDSAIQNLFLRAYIVNSANSPVLTTNAIQLSVPDGGAWSNIATGRSLGDVVVFRIQSTTGGQMHVGLNTIGKIRVYEELYQISLGFAVSDVAGNVEGAQSSTGEAFWMYGYFPAPAIGGYKRLVNYTRRQTRIGR